METLIRRLSEEQLKLLPTEEDIAFYEEHGWFITKKVLSDEIIDEAILGAQRFYRGERDRTLPYTTGYSDWKPGDGDDVRNNEFVCYQKKEFLDLALQPIIGAIAARLARTKEIRIFDDSLVYKAPTTKVNQGIVGWHTDQAYTSNCTSDKMLTAWVPFHDSERNRSPLVVIDGSHKWSGTENLRYFNIQNLEDIKEELIKSGREVVEVPIVMKKGHISFHHGWTIHGSYPNFSNSHRLALAIYMQDGENHYQPFWNQGREIHHFVDSVCRQLPNGYPDYSDPNICPVMWSE